jgi:ABC-2 type transport system permease protein
MRELKANRKGMIIWNVIMVLFVVSGMSKYTAYSAGGADIFNKMPDTLKALLGIGPFDGTKMPGFYAFLFSYIVIVAAIHAVLLGNGIIAKEERDKTTEFLMIKPVSRTAVITAKLLAALTNILVLNIVTLLSSVSIVAAYKAAEDITGEILVFMLSMFLVQLIFLSFGGLMASIIRRPKASGSLATGILFLGYVIAKVTDMTDRLDALNILSPFKYFDTAAIVNGDGLNPVIVLLSIALTAVFVIGTYFYYRRRDLNI